MSICLIENNSACLSSDESEAEQNPGTDDDAASSSPNDEDDDDDVDNSKAKGSQDLAPLGLSFSRALSLVVGRTFGFASTETTSVSGSNSDAEARTPVEEAPGLKLIALDEVAWHDTIDDCWMVVYDYVYDLTGFLRNHPGGQDVLLEYAGRDATLAFVGSGHSRAANRILDKYLIGELPLSERIFRISNGIKIGDFI